MGRPELGTKCACASCAERFYDLNRSPAICPKCGAQQPPPVPRTARPIRSSAAVQFNRRPVRVAVEEAVEPIGEVEAPEVGEDEEDDDEAEIDTEVEVETDHMRASD